MKMKKKLFALLALLLVLSLAACGGSSKNSAAADSNTPMEAPQAPSVNYDSAEMGWDMPAMTPEEAPAPSPDGGYGSTSGSYGGVPANAKIIYTANLALETKEFDDASKALAALVADVGGYFESKTVNQGYYRSMDAVVRVPVANFTSFLDRAGETAHAVNRSEYLDDVSEAYYDQESRLTTQRVSWNAFKSCWERRRIWRTLSPSRAPSATRSWRSNTSLAASGSMTARSTTLPSPSPSARSTAFLQMKKCP